MSAWTKEQRAIAAAHLCEITSLALRTAGTSPTIREAHARVNLIMLDDPASVRWYRECLAMFGVSADIDAAVAAIARGEHPPTSLPGRVAEYRRKVGNEWAATGCTARGHRCEGETHALGHVLALLGCEVPK